MAVLNLKNLALETWQKGSFYGATEASFGAQLGLSRLGAAYTEVPPGRSACPFHSHSVEEELFVILDGTGTYRFGDTQQPIGPGDVLAAPAGGPETAHQIINTGTVTLRFLALSANAGAEIVQYPDSGKVLTRATLPDGRKFRRMARERDDLDYWQGEPGSD